MPPSPEAPSCARCRRPLRAPSPPGGPRLPRQRGTVVATRNWPEGSICSGCYATACETYGTCPTCATTRLLPGRDEHGHAVCADCAGRIGDFTCTRCGQEGWKQLKGLCGRCVLRDRLTAALDDGTGTLCPDLAPLLEYLCAMHRPRSGLLWLTKRHTLPLLAQLATGQVPLTHDGLATLTPYPPVAYLRQLLIAAAVLPEVDPTLLRIHYWSIDYLAGIEDPETRATITQYYRWGLQPSLQRAAAATMLHPYRDQSTRYQLRQAATFLCWLTEQHLPLADLGQGDLDQWLLAATRAQRGAVKTFLRWAARTHRAPPLRITPAPYPPAAPLSQQQRLHWLHRAALDDTLDPLDRVLLTLLLLYAQPIHRISRLRTHDIDHDPDGSMRIRLGEPAVPVPTPFDQVIAGYLEHTRAPTIGNADSTWLLPGRLGTLPLHPTSLRMRLTLLGLQPRAARTATLRQLVTQAPPAIIGDMLGYRTTTAERQAKAAGSTWARYAALRISNQ